MSDSPPKVLLLIESSRGYGRGCLRGVARYVRAHGPWHTLHYERSLGQAFPESAKAWEPQGVIVRAESQAVAEAVNKMNVPTIDLRGVYPPKHGRTLVVDDNGCAAMALDHLTQRGFSHVAFCGFVGVAFSDRREQAFLAHARAAHLHVHTYQPPTQLRFNASVLRRETIGELHQETLRQWLADLPKPVGVFACNDVRGRQVVDAARDAGLQVPEQVAVLGVDNDTVVCDLANPPLSSIDPDGDTIGFEAAAMLDAMMQGEPLDTVRQAFPPARVEARLSTDMLAVDDTEVAKAVSFIRQHACTGLSVGDVVDHLTISRATLERRFRAALGRTPKSEINRIRIDRAKQLLEGTNYPLPQIADMTGFGSPARFSVAFSRAVGESPGRYRRQRTRE